MNIEAFDTKIKSIKDELNSLNNSILSWNEKINKIKELQEKTNNTKEELEKEMSTLSEEEKEKAQAQLDTLNELINFELLLYKTATDNNKPEQSWNWDKKEWFFSKTKDWIGSQRSDIRDKDKRKDETGKNLLRSAWFIATWGWAIALVVGWIKRLVERRREKKAAETATQTNPENPETEVEQGNKPWFRKRPFWKVLKRLWIWSAVAWWTYVVWKRLNRRDRLKERRSNRWNKDNTNPDTEVQQEFWKEELWQLSWFENECKELTNQANSRRKLASKNGTDYVDNAKEYRRILNKALYLQTEALEIYDKIFNSNESSIQTKNETDNLKNSIDSAVRKIYQMKDEVFQNVPEWADLWDKDDLGWSYSWNWDSGRWSWNNSWWNNSWFESQDWWDETPETFEAINANIFSTAAINYLKTNVPELPLDDDTQENVQRMLNWYFNSYPILKKSNKKNMIFEIWNKTKFSETLKSIWNEIESWIGFFTWLFGRKKIKELGAKINNFENELKNSSSNDYENIIFKYLWWIVQDVVKYENWTMTVQNYYDSIKKHYPNKNDTQISNDLQNSGQSNVDIKYMDANKIVQAQA